MAYTGKTQQKLPFTAAFFVQQQVVKKCSWPAPAAAGSKLYIS
jgi:hypothetical protein